MREAKSRLQRNRSSFKEDRQVLLPIYRQPSEDLIQEIGFLDDELDDGDCFSTLTLLFCRLETAEKLSTGVMSWASPIPAFGGTKRARIATLGLNPSNREFVDENGNELTGRSRRFHTLESIGLESWLDADVRHLQQVLSKCRSYFKGNPYDTWFKPLDYLVSGMGGTFYGAHANACHLDLIPFATTHKWTELSTVQRSKLLTISADTLALIIRDSSLSTLVLNGRSVVEQFEALAGIRLNRDTVPEFSLRRKKGGDVNGVGFYGKADTLCGIPLSQELLILGYNHNLQSSFGVSREVTGALRAWLSRMCGEGL